MMEYSLLTVFAAVILTAVASIVKDTKDALDLLMFQAGMMGAVELLRGLNELYMGLLPDALIDFSSTALLWIFGVAVTPAIISKGISRAGNHIEKPLLGKKRSVIVMTTIAILFFVLTVLSIRFRLFPEQLDMFPLYALIFSLSVFNMMNHRDPLKVLIGLNMAENALMPLMAEVQLIYIALAMASMEFVNEIAIFIIAEGRAEFGSLQLGHWRNQC